MIKTEKKENKYIVTTTTDETKDLIRVYDNYKKVAVDDNIRFSHAIDIIVDGKSRYDYQEVDKIVEEPVQETTENEEEEEIHFIDEAEEQNNG